MVCIKPFIKSAIKLHAQNSEWILKSGVEKAQTFQILQQTRAYFITRPTYIRIASQLILKKESNNQSTLLNLLDKKH